MNELWPCASLHLPERGKREKAANKHKKKPDLELLFLASPSYSFWSSCAKNVKNSECSLFIYLSVKYFFFPSGSDGNQCLMAHLRYSKTTWKERESKDRSGEKKGRKEGNWCLCVCVSLRGGVCLLAEDCADVRAVAGLTHHSTRLKKEGFSPLCFKYHRPSKWAPTCLRNK